jgi:mRNA interferase MazF
LFFSGFLKRIWRQSQLRQYADDFDEIIGERDGDFGASGLKAPSVIRVGRRAVVEAGILVGAIGEIDPARLKRIKGRLARWLNEEELPGV